MPRDKPIVQPSGLALLGAVGAGFFVIAMAVAHLGRPDHDPVSHFISELALGTTAQLFATSCLVLGPSILAIGAAFHLALAPSRRRRLGVIFMGVAAIGVLLLPFFPMSPPNGYTTPETVVHGAIATAAFLSLNAGVVMLTRAVSVDPRWQRHRRALGGFALVGTALLVTFVGMVGIAEMDKSTNAAHFAGAVERAVIGANLAWCILATAALRQPLATPKPAAAAAPTDAPAVVAGDAPVAVQT